jgi:hypothetical protein
LQIVFRLSIDLVEAAGKMDKRYRALLQQTADVVQTRIVTRTNKEKAHSVIVDFIKANPQMTYPEIAKAVGLHPVTVNRIALEGGQRRGSGRRQATKDGLVGPGVG